MTTAAAPKTVQGDFDALIVGAGFSGLYQLHCLRDRLGMNVRVLEAADGALGTGTDIRARGATPKAIPTASTSPTSWWTNGNGRSVIRSSRKSCAI